MRRAIGLLIAFLGIALFAGAQQRQAEKKPRRGEHRDRKKPEEKPHRAAQREAPAA